MPSPDTALATRGLEQRLIQMAYLISLETLPRCLKYKYFPCKFSLRMLYRFYIFIQPTHLNGSEDDVMAYQVNDLHFNISLNTYLQAA